MNELDQLSERMIECARQHRWTEFETSLQRIEFVTHYGESRLSWRGIHNIGHIIRSLLSSHMAAFPGQGLNLADPITAKATENVF